MKKLVPYGNRILVKRKKISETQSKSSIVLPDSVQERTTDIATVVYVPEHSFADKKLIENSEVIINKICDKANEGSSEALKALLEFNFYLKIKDLQPGDVVMLSRYGGVDFVATGESEMLTLCEPQDIMGKVI